MNKISTPFYMTVFLAILTFSKAKAQETAFVKYPFLIDLPSIDLPFIKQSALASLHKNNIKNVARPSLANYLSSYESPSMQQATKSENI